MAQETWVRSQVESYQRLKKYYLMPPCLTLGIIRYRSRVKWSNPGKGVAPSPTPWYGSYRKGSLQVTLDYVRQLTYLLELCDDCIFVGSCQIKILRMWWVSAKFVPMLLALEQQEFLITVALICFSVKKSM